MDKNAIYGMVSREESFHPRVLRIPSPPKVVYRQGDLTLLERSILGVVGPRLMSPYAEKVLRELFTQLLGYQNIVTISGLADGVDTRCHQLSLEHRIPTIAVLGGGFGYFLK